MGKVVNLDFLFKSIVSARVLLQSRQRHTAAGQYEGDNYFVDHSVFEAVKRVARTGSVLAVLHMGQEEPTDGYLELASWVWWADRLTCPGSGRGGLPL